MTEINYDVFTLVIVNLITIALYVKSFGDKLEEEYAILLRNMSINLALLTIFIGLILMYYGK